MAKILIIGGGVSGISAGIYAQKLGHNAIICEKHSISGGNLTGWHRDGCYIDNCIHWLTGTNPSTETYKMWLELGAVGNVEIIQCDTLYTCELNGKRISLNKDLKKTKNDMLVLSPQDKNEIDSLIDAVEIMQAFCKIGGKDHNEGFKAYQALQAIPSLSKYKNLTISQLSNKFSHPLLRDFIRSFWGEDFGALALITVFAHFCGSNGGIPRGGSLEMAKRMEKRFISLGGTLLLNKEAEKILCKNKKADAIRFSDGDIIYADAIIITADPRMVFGKLINAPMPSYLQKKYDAAEYKRFSSYHCAFVYDGIDPPFRGDYIFSIPQKYRNILRSDKIILREFSHEKSFAPEGKTIIQTMIFCSEAYAKRFIDLKETDKEAYQRKKQSFCCSIENLIYEQLPQTVGKLKCIDSWTPATYRRFVNSQIGSYMSFILPSKKIPIRTGNRIRGISNVILATQWQQIPGGLPIAAQSGKLAAEKLQFLKLNEKRAPNSGKASTPVTSK